MTMPLTPSAAAAIASEPNTVWPAVLRIVGTNSRAAAMKSSAIGVPTGICVGLSLCCVNLTSAASENAKPAAVMTKVDSLPSQAAAARFALPR